MVSSLLYSPRYPSLLVLKKHFQLQHLQRTDTDLNSPTDLKFLMTCHLLDHIVPQKSLSTSNMFPYSANNIKVLPPWQTGALRSLPLYRKLP